MVGFTVGREPEYPKLPSRWAISSQYCYLVVIHPRSSKHTKSTPTMLASLCLHCPLLASQSERHVNCPLTFREDLSVTGKGLLRMSCSQGSLSAPQLQMFASEPMPHLQQGNWMQLQGICFRSAVFRSALVWCCEAKKDGSFPERLQLCWTLHVKPRLLAGNKNTGNNLFNEENQVFLLWWQEFSHFSGCRQ